jgi:hypothetical protein
MSESYQRWTRDQAWLLPPSLHEWLAQEHVVWFVVEVVSQLDLGPIEASMQAKDARGQRAYPPSMMVALLA